MISDLRPCGTTNCSYDRFPRTSSYFLLSTPLSMDRHSHNCSKHWASGRSHDTSSVLSFVLHPIAIFKLKSIDFLWSPFGCHWCSCHVSVRLGWQVVMAIVESSALTARVPKRESAFVWFFPGRWMMLNWNFWSCSSQWASYPSGFLILVNHPRNHVQCGVEFHDPVDMA